MVQQQLYSLRRNRSVYLSRVLWQRPRIDFLSRRRYHFVLPLSEMPMSLSERSVQQVLPDFFSSFQPIAIVNFNNRLSAVVLALTKKLDF